jgi:hypothetical protein
MGQVTKISGKNGLRTLILETLNLGHGYDARKKINSVFLTLYYLSKYTAKGKARILGAAQARILGAAQT